jgi:hypothetical protein
MAYDKTTIWDGGGGDNNWDTAGNWDNGVPGANSLAQFDATSTKNCDLNDNQQVGGLDIQAGYAGGTISVDAGETLTISGDAGGALADFTVANNTDLITFAGTSTLAITGSGNISFPHFTAAAKIMTFANGITTIVTGLIRAQDVTTGNATSTIKVDAGTLNFRIDSSLTINGTTWGGGTGTLVLQFSGVSAVPGDDYGDCNLTFADTITNTMQGNVTTTGNVVVLPMSNDQTAILTTNGHNLTCANLDLGGLAQTNKGGYLKVTGVSVIDVSGDVEIFPDDGAQTNLFEVAAAGTNAISCGGDWTVGSGGAMDMQDSTVTFNGGAAQAITSGAQSFYNVTVTNTAGDVSFADAVTIAGTFDPSGGSTIKFDETGAHTIHDWDLVGSAGNLITLLSEVNGNQWDVTVTMSERGVYVDVKDSNLSGANVDVSAGSNVDSGNNSNNWLWEVDNGDYEDDTVSPSIEIGV